MDLGWKRTHYIVDEAVKQQVNAGLQGFKGGKKKKIYCSLMLHNGRYHQPVSERAACVVAVIVPSGSSYTSLL